METDTKPFIGTEALAERWGIDKKTLLAAIARNDIPCNKVGRRWLIPTAWVKSREALQPESAQND